MTQNYDKDIKVVALIVAGGRGRRAGTTMPKQYRPLGQKPLLRYCLDIFYRHPCISTVQVVMGEGDGALYDASIVGLGDLKLGPPVIGGKERQDSVRLGLEALKAVDPDVVLIHDAARPFITPALITDLIKAAHEAGAAIAALPLTDTLKRTSDGANITDTVDRQGLWRAQTPQAFRFDSIVAAHTKMAGHSLTDDAAIAEAVGMDVKLVHGDARNIKVTTQEDFAIAEAFLKMMSDEPPLLPLVGQGYDVHRLAPGDGLILCGVDIPCAYKLMGHSDADVALHALTDALLGTIGAGDIGLHFPPTEKKWKGAASSLFLTHAASLVAERGGTLLNVDITLICEQPKIAPHREAMGARVASLLQIDEARVNIKATTTEGLGFTGRGEGIAAQAIVSILMPSKRKG